MEPTNPRNSDTSSLILSCFFHMNFTRNLEKTWYLRTNFLRENVTTELRAQISGRRSGGNDWSLERNDLAVGNVDVVVASPLFQKTRQKVSSPAAAVERKA